MRLSRKTAVFTTLAVAAFALGGAALGRAAPTEAGDFYLICKPTCAASTGGTHISGHSSKTSFTVPAGVSGAPTVTCTNSAAGGTPPAKSAGLAAFAISPLPAFNDGSSTTPCKDQFGNRYTTTTNNTNGKWTIGFIDFGSETTTEPNTGDRLTVHIPRAGAIVKTSTGCTITVASSAAVTISSPYTDGVKNSSGTPVYHFNVNIKNLPVRITGMSTCPLITPSTSSCAGQQPAVCSSFVGVYAFSPGVRDSA
jgi:hypothetical protein